MHISITGCKKVWGHDGERFGAPCPYCRIEELEKKVEELERADEDIFSKVCPKCHHVPPICRCEAEE